jgi:hypothetical protein
MMTVDQLIAEQKSNVQVAFGLAGKTFEGVEKSLPTTPKM